MQIAHGNLCNGVSATATVRLVFRGTESCVRIVDVRHVFVSVFLRRFRLTSIHSKGDTVLGSSCLLLLSLKDGSLHKASLDSQPTIGEILATIVSNFLVPYAPRPFALKPGNDSCPFGGGVDPNAAILVVHLVSNDEGEERMSGNVSMA